MKVAALGFNCWRLPDSVVLQDENREMKTKVPEGGRGPSSVTRKGTRGIGSVG